MSDPTIDSWYDAHEPGRPTPPGSTYTVLLDFITPRLASSFRELLSEAPGDLFITGQRLAPGYSRLNLLAYLQAFDERYVFIQRAQQKMAKHIGGRPKDWSDCWLLRYLPGSGIRDHVDPVPGRDKADHTRYRLNVLLSPPGSSGKLFIEDRYVPLSQHDAIIFSSGSLIHRVETVPELRCILSLGMLGPKEVQ